MELREGKPAWFELQVLSHSDFKVEWFHDGYMITTSRARFIITSTDMRNAIRFILCKLIELCSVTQVNFHSALFKKSIVYGFFGKECLLFSTLVIVDEWKITVSNEVTYVTLKVTVTGEIFV